MWATNTGERLRAAAVVQNRKPKDAAAAVEAFYLVQRFRIQQQLSAGHPQASNRLNPATLNDLNRLMLKHAFKQGQKLQQRLKMDYGL